MKNNRISTDEIIGIVIIVLAIIVELIFLFYGINHWSDPVAIFWGGIGPLIFGYCGYSIITSTEEDSDYEVIMINAKTNKIVIYREDS